jgi:hypothetical protein
MADAALRSAEDIALLSLLQPCKSDSLSGFPPPAIRTKQPSRLLSLEDEEELTGVLAYLAGITNDRNHIMAVAVEEVMPLREMRILVAVNRDNHLSNKDILGRAVAVLTDLFHHVQGRLAKLSCVSSSGKTWG